MKKVSFLTLIILLTLALLLPLPVFAEEVTTAEETEASTESVTEPEIETEPVTESETAAETDDTFAEILKHATPEEMELIEQIILGGVENLDKLGMTGYDRVRVWIEQNPTTVMMGGLLLGIVVLIVTNILLKRGVSKSEERLTENAKTLYEEGGEMYAKAEKVCADVLEYARRATEEAKAAHGEVSAERALLNRELGKVEIIEQSMTEMINFLLQCSDLSQAKRDEAEAIIKRGKEALERYEKDGE